MSGLCKLCMLLTRGRTMPTCDSMLYRLPFTTFGEAAAFGLEVRVTCRCSRVLIVDGTADAVCDRPIMGARFRCTTILPHGVPCAAGPSVYIGKRGRWRWTQAEHSRAIRARQAAAPIDAKPSTYGQVVKRGEVAYLYDQGCVPPYTIDAIELDEPPWDRFLAKPVGRFLCPGCRKPMKMHVHHGPGTPATERFGEVA